MPKPLIIAHRGDAKNKPENTLPAFESAMRNGADGIELDVHLTKDDQLVVHHYFGFGDTSRPKSLIFEMTLDEVQARKIGGDFSPAIPDLRIPTLAEVFDLGKGKIRFEIDLKGSSLQFLRNVIAEVERFGIEDDVELTTAHYALLTHAKQINPHIQTGTFFNPPPDWMALRLAQRHIIDWATLFDIQVAHVNRVFFSDGFVEEIHRHGLLVHGSNLSMPAEIEQGLSMGIDRFSTDEIEVALQVRDEFIRQNAKY